jgi:hypothetical protein
MGDIVKMVEMVDQVENIQTMRHPASPYASGGGQRDRPDAEDDRADV